jgi:hypothetical protein
VDKPIAWMMTYEETGNISFFNDRYNADAFRQANPDWTCTPLYAASPKPEQEAFTLDRGCWERGCCAYDTRDGDGVIVYVDPVNMSQERVDETAKRKHEPVAWLQTIFGPGGHVYYRLVHDSEMKDTDKSNYMPLYASPPKREWIELTNEDIHNTEGYEEDRKMFRFAKSILAKAKEKNGG